MDTATLSELDEQQRAVVMRRWQVLRLVLQDGVPLTVAARDAQVPLRSAQRWLSRYRTGGLAGWPAPAAPTTAPAASRTRQSEGARHISLKVSGAVLRRRPRQWPASQSLSYVYALLGTRRLRLSHHPATLCSVGPRP